MLWQDDELTNCCRIYVLLHTLLQDFSPSQDGSSEENREASRRSDAGYAIQWVLERSLEALGRISFVTPCRLGTGFT